MNGMQAIEMRPVGGRLVRVQLLRESQTSLALEEGEGARPPIIGFRVSDDGIGFDEANFESFCTSDSTYKLEIGGRGVGRFTWLKAFRRVVINSVFRTDGAVHRRTFEFTAKGISTPVVEPVDATTELGTTVELLDIDAAFQREIPKKLSTVGQRITDHFLVAIRAAKKPVRVVAADDEGEFDVSEAVTRAMATAIVDKITVANEPFTVTHLRMTSPEVNGHRLSFLANRREVRSDLLGTAFAQLKGRLDDESGSFWWLALVEGPFLDRSVAPERNKFTFPDAPDDLFAQRLTLQAIRDAAHGVLFERLDPFLAPVKARVREQVRQYVETEAPEYRAVAAMRPEAVERLAPDLSKDKLDQELHKIEYQIESDLRAQGKTILADPEVDEAKFEKFVSDANAVGKANLAKYIVHRRVILDMLRKATSATEAGRFPLEEAVHKIIFPLKKTSDEVPYEQLNLWIIDEKLAYHSYLASDLELRAVEVLETDDQQRPDLMVFKGAFAFADHQAPLLSVTIVEFKRAERDDYDDKKNPISQVYKYVRAIREGNARDRNGRTMRVTESVPFYCYVVCDITPKLKIAASERELKLTPDGHGYFGFNTDLKAYVEVISFDKLLSDAERRNRIFFEKLNIR